jgi:hypothetical protein
MTLLTPQSKLCRDIADEGYLLQVFNVKTDS